MTKKTTALRALREGVSHVVAARWGAFADFAPPPEQIEDEALAYLASRYGARFEVVELERAGFAGPTDVIVARRCDAVGGEVTIRRFPADGHFEG